MEVKMKLSEFELDIMQLLWQHEPCTASQLHKALLADTQKDKKVAYTTVKTIVDRLEQKARLCDWILEKTRSPSSPRYNSRIYILGKPHIY